MQLPYPAGVYYASVSRLYQNELSGKKRRRKILGVRKNARETKENKVDISNSGSVGIR